MRPRIMHSIETTFSIPLPKVILGDIQMWCNFALSRVRLLGKIISNLDPNTFLSHSLSDTIILSRYHWLTWALESRGRLSYRKWRSCATKVCASPSVLWIRVESEYVGHMFPPVFEVNWLQNVIFCAKIWWS